MGTLETESTQPAPPAAKIASANGAPHPIQPGDLTRNRRRLSFGGFLLFLLILGLAAGAGYTYKVGKERAQEDAYRLMAQVWQYVGAKTKPPAESKPIESTPATPWDGFVRLNKQDAKAIGLFVPTVSHRLSRSSSP